MTSLGNDFQSADAGIGEGLDEVKVAQHQIALRGDRETDAAALKLLQKCTGTTILL